MKIRIRSTMVAAAAGLALAATTAGGLALAADGPQDWYDGDNAAVADPHNTGIDLTLHDATGAVRTSGSTTEPIAAFAAAASGVRAGDSFATLFVHLAQSDTAPGAWPGLQVTGTDRYTGTGAVTAPAALAGKPFVRTTAAGYSLADVVAALPNDESSASFEGVYELRLRTSSPSLGVSTDYASTYVKVTGSTWQVTDAPVLGEGSGESTRVQATWPTKAVYGAPGSVRVTVAADQGVPGGTVRVVSGGTTLVEGPLSSGTATLALPKDLAPGRYDLRAVYAGGSGFEGSQSSATTVTVGKGKPGKPKLTVSGRTATVKVPTAAGLAKAGGKATITLTRGGTTKTVAVTIKKGVGTATLPAGSWTAVVTYAGDRSWSGATSKPVQVSV